MGLRRLSRRLFDWLRPGLRSGRSPVTRQRGPLTHVIILDGTMSTLTPGEETNAGLSYRLLSELGAQVSLYYEAGVQWQDWRSTPDVMMGRGINRQIRRAYGYLASRYRPGDRVFLLGYSRGAYAVRSLAGVVDQVGLLRAEHATERNIQLAYRHYQSPAGSAVAEVFRTIHCHARFEIEMVGAWDTVKALGVRLPFLWKWSEVHHAFHSHQLGPSVKHGFHALARDETRQVFEPVLWECPNGDNDPQDDQTAVARRVEQVWFRGTHGDIGGQLGGFDAARPLANISLVWMLERIESCGLQLPEGWRMRFPTDPGAPSVGTWSSWGKLFLLRKRRVIGRDPSERLHETAVEPTVASVPGWAAHLRG
ncbi:DUF2235 domain-containing protein [Thalassovita taeanensis]|uniref:Uncharacterized alpha/beta hydrolase domain n=1 Tax=Thalassovita taeanensis TaxID=657014 RepID=A0A1H9FGX4_9RHOB|nr:DUF2235 domain-containing protein [Thalassovita taeanensis]SEQ36568.1 Uncharacterized alpha/beta hydrolase domain [Thalassovita taeanensis]